MCICIFLCVSYRVLIDVQIKAAVIILVKAIFQFATEYFNYFLLSRQFVACYNESKSLKAIKKNSENEEYDE